MPLLLRYDINTYIQNNFLIFNQPYKQQAEETQLNDFAVTQITPSLTTISQKSLKTLQSVNPSYKFIKTQIKSKWPTINSPINILIITRNFKYNLTPNTPLKT